MSNTDGAEARASVATTLAGSLTVLTAALGAVGGLTGGIARMFRNHESSAGIVFALILGGIFIALAARLVVRGKTVSTILLTVSALLFAGGTFLGIQLMINTASLRDRPLLSAQLVMSSEGHWSVKGSASTSGMKAYEGLQLFIYAVPKNPAEQSQPVRLFYVNSGPNADGISTQDFDVPLPVEENYQAYVVTANLGDVARDCEGRAFNAVSDPLETTPLPGRDQKVDNACLTFVPPAPESASQP